MKRFLNRLQKSRRSRSSSRSETSDNKNTSTTLGDVIRQLHSNSEKESSKLHKAVWVEDLKKVQLLVKRQSMVPDPDNRTPLHIACMKGNAEITRVLLEFNAKVNALDKDLQTPLMKAIESKSPECVHLLIDYKADATIFDTNGNQSIHHAVCHGCKDVIQILIYAGVHINSRNKFGNTPLHLAINRQEEELVDWLITQGADIDCTDNHKRTPLMLASILGNASLVQRLLQNGADTQLQDDQGSNAAQLSRRYLHTDCEKLILQAVEMDQSQLSLHTSNTSNPDMASESQGQFELTKSRSGCSSCSEQSVEEEGSVEDSFIESENIHSTPASELGNEVEFREAYADDVLLAETTHQMDSVRPVSNILTSIDEIGNKDYLVCQKINQVQYSILTANGVGVKPEGHCEVLRVSRLDQWPSLSEMENKSVQSFSTASQLNPEEDSGHSDSFRTRTLSNKKLATDSCHMKSKCLTDAEQSSLSSNARHFSGNSPRKRRQTSLENVAFSPNPTARKTKYRTLDLHNDPDQNNLAESRLKDRHNTTPEQPFENAQKDVRQLVQQPPVSPAGGDKSWISDTDSEEHAKLARVETLITQKIREHANRSFLSRSTLKSSHSNSPLRENISAHGSSNDANKGSNWDSDQSINESPAVRRSRTQFLTTEARQTMETDSCPYIILKSNKTGSEYQVQEKEASDWDSDELSRGSLPSCKQDPCVVNEPTQQNHIEHQLSYPYGTLKKAIECDSNPEEDTSYSYSENDLKISSNARPFQKTEESIERRNGRRLPDLQNVALSETEENQTHYVAQTLEEAPSVFEPFQFIPQRDQVVVSVQSIASEDEESESVNLSPIAEVDEHAELESLNQNAEPEQQRIGEEDNSIADTDVSASLPKLSEPLKPVTERVLSSTLNISTLHGIPTMTDQPKVVDKRSRMLKRKADAKQTISPNTASVNQMGEPNKSDLCSEGEVVYPRKDLGLTTNEIGLTMNDFADGSEALASEMVDETCNATDSVKQEWNHMTSNVPENAAKDKVNQDELPINVRDEHVANTFVPRPRRSAKSSLKDGTVCNTSSTSLASCSVPERQLPKSDYLTSSNKANEAMTENEEHSIRTESLSSMTFPRGTEAFSDYSAGKIEPHIEKEPIRPKHREVISPQSKGLKEGLSTGLKQTESLLKSKLVYALKELQRQHTCFEELEASRKVAHEKLLEITLEDLKKVSTECDPQSNNESERLIRLETELIELKFRYEEECEEKNELENRLQQNILTLTNEELRIDELMREQQQSHNRVAQLERQLVAMTTEKQQLEEEYKQLSADSKKRRINPEQLMQIKDATTDLRDKLKDLRQTCCQTIGDRVRKLESLVQEISRSISRVALQPARVEPKMNNEQGSDYAIQHPEPVVCPSVEPSEQLTKKVAGDGREVNIPLSRSNELNRHQADYDEIQQLKEHLISSEARVLGLTGHMESMLKLMAESSVCKVNNTYSDVYTQTQVVDSTITMAEILARLEKAEQLVRCMSTTASSCSSLTHEKIQRMLNGMPHAVQTEIPLAFENANIIRPNNYDATDLKSCNEGSRLRVEPPFANEHHELDRNMEKSSPRIHRQLSLPDEETISLRRRVAELESDRAWLTKQNDKLVQRSGQNLVPEEKPNIAESNFVGGFPQHMSQPLTYPVPHPLMMAPPYNPTGLPFAPCFPYGTVPCSHSKCSNTQPVCCEHECLTCKSKRKKPKRRETDDAFDQRPKQPIRTNLESVVQTAGDDESCWSLNDGSRPEMNPVMNKRLVQNDNFISRHKLANSFCNELLLKLRPEIDRSINRHLEASESLRLGNTTNGNLLGFGLAASNTPYHSKTVSMLLIDAGENLKNLSKRHEPYEKPSVQSAEYLEYLKQKYFV